jgi:hypothetical protein
VTSGGGGLDVTTPVRCYICYMRIGGGQLVSGATTEGRGTVFGQRFPWGREWSACRRCGGVHVASSVGWNSGPILFYHIYCMITSSEMGIGVGKGTAESKACGSWGANGICLSGARSSGLGIVRKQAGRAEVWRGNSKTSRQVHRER